MLNWKGPLDTACNACDKVIRPGDYIEIVHHFGDPKDYHYCSNKCQRRGRFVGREV